MNIKTKEIMMRSIFLSSIVFLSLFYFQSCQNSSAQKSSNIVADYSLTDKDALGAVQGPATIKNNVGPKYILNRSGEPQYYNVPPNKEDGRSLSFNGEHASYIVDGGIPLLKEGFVLECWARANTNDTEELKGIVSYGDGTSGYLLVQQGSEWGVFVGGVGFVKAGLIKNGQWTHIAIAVSKNKAGSIYINGIEKGSFTVVSAIAENFSIGSVGEKHFFKGDIARVRLSKIGDKKFEPKKDLLIDNFEITETEIETNEGAKKRIASILKNIETTTSIKSESSSGDWLVRKPDIKSKFQVKIAADRTSAEMLLGNGLASRKFFLGANLACYSYKHEVTGEEFLRSVKPEASLSINGSTYPVGGMKFTSMVSGHKSAVGEGYVGNYFLQEWLDKMISDPNAFQLVGVKTSQPEAWLKWKPMSSLTAAPWPPKGLRVTMTYEAPENVADLAGLRVNVNYEIYDGIPVIGKWLSFENNGDKSITLERTLIEELAITDDNANKIYIESEYNHFHATPTRWSVDPDFNTDSGPIYTERMSDYRLRYWNQEELDNAAVDFGRHPEWQGEYRSRGLLKVQYPVGPNKTLAKGDSWNTFRVWTLLQDDMDEDRKGLARRQLYRVLMPWTSENLIYMHVLSDKSEAIRKAVDQCAEVGFEMIILTFGSGFNMMSKDPEYIARIKGDFEYAHSKGIKTGAYILFCSSRSYGNGEHDAVPAAYGRSLCLGSEFSDKYFDQVLGFMEETAMDCIETDGPYHGYRCESSEHSLHNGAKDSYTVNWEQQVKFYNLCMDKEIYIITPDWYPASGGRKMPMGYKESNWTLPRPQQALVARQNIYDGTWWRTASMGYHALPLTPVYGGGPNSTMEPLNDHLKAYDAVLSQYFGMGIMAAYRGFRLYDTNKTYAVVKGWVDFYKRHEPIINSDIIHVRRPDGRNLDCMLHANATLEEKGLAFIWNPTNKKITQNFALPLYYTGIKDEANVTINTEFNEINESNTYKLDRRYNIEIPVSIPANSYVWILIK